MYNVLLRSALFTVFLLCAVPAFAIQEVKGFHIENLLQAALENNPELKAAQYRWRLYENKVAQSGVLDDPFLSLSLNNYPVDSWASNEYPTSGKILKLTQNFPFPGKLAAQKEKSMQQALWYRGVYEDGKLQLAWKVKDAYYSLLFYDQALKITRKNIEVLDGFIRMTESNYETGRGLQQDILKAQVERSKLIDRTYTFNQQLQGALADLSTLTSQPLTLPGGDIPEIEIKTLLKTLDELKSSSEQNRPLFSSYRALIEQNKLQKKLARLEFKPDFKLGASYTFREPNLGDDGTDFTGIEFGVTIPIFVGKRHAAVAEAEMSINMVSQQLENFRNTVHFNIEDSFLRAKRSEEQVELYRNGLIPQASQAFEAALSGYQVGKIDFLALQDSLMTVYNYELEYYRVATDGQRSLARLDAETGSRDL